MYNCVYKIYIKIYINEVKMHDVSRTRALIKSKRVSAVFCLPTKSRSSGAKSEEKEKKIWALESDAVEIKTTGQNKI